MKLLAFIHAHLGDARGLFRRAMLITFLEGLATAGPVIAVALGLMRLAQGPADALALLPYAVAVVAAVALRIVLIRLAWSSGFRAGNVATEAIRNRLVGHMRAVPLGALGRWSAARLATLVTEDGRWINEASTFTLNRLFGGLAAGLCLLLAAAWFDLATALAVLFAFGLGLLSLPVAGRILKGVIARRNAELTDISQRIGEYGEGIAVFRSFQAGEGAFARFAEAVDRLRRLMLGYTPVLVSLHGVAATLMGAGLPLALMLLAWRGGEAAPSLIPALLLGLAASHALSAAVLGQMLPFSLGIQAEAGMGRFLAEPVLAHRGRQPGTPLDFTLERVAFSYDGERGAVDNIALAARQGGMTAIVGPSGAGKSSVIGLMMRFFDPQSGRVTVGGVDIADIPPARLQALTALVNQDVHLFRDTLRANILLGAPSADEARLAAAIRAARLEELIAALPGGLDTVIGEGGRTLSGGERQRVAVARALLKDAPILLLDEASSAMDPLTERAIQQAVAALESGRTLVVVAHRLRSIAEADRICVMDQGRVVEEGRHSDLLALDGLYARLWQAQERAAGWRLR